MYPVNSPAQAQAADVIAYAFYGLGYRPSDHLIIVSTHRGRRAGQLELAAVVTCPRPRDRPELIELTGIDDVAAVLRDSGADGAFVIMVGSDLDPAGPSLPTDTTQIEPPDGVRIGLDVARTLQLHDLEIQDVLLVGPTRYRSIWCSSPDCCPAQGLPVAQILSSRAAAAMVVSGRALADAEGDLLSDLTPEPDAALAAMLQRRQLTRNVPMTTRQRRAAASGWLKLAVDLTAAAQGAGGDGVVGDVRREYPAHEDMPLATPRLTRSEITRWLLALDDDVLRDCALIPLVSPDPVIAEQLMIRLANGETEAASEALNGGGPQASLAPATKAVLTALVRGAPVGHRAPALTLLAWRSWWEGDGVRARLLAERALQDRAEYRLAVLLSGLLRQGAPPLWVRRSPRARAS